MSGGNEIAYRPRGRIVSLRGGAHVSGTVGTLGTFRDQVPFMVHPDARRIDVRATLRDPFENTFVRRFQHRASIDVYAVVDLTRSLAYEGHARKKDLITELCAALAQSATRSGDRFGLLGCDAAVRDDCFIPATRRPGIFDEVAVCLSHAPFQGASADGLNKVAERLAGRRKMVFLISDFLLPLSLIRQVFESLAMHDVIPVVIGDSSEDAALPDWGLLEFVDLETSARRVVFMRPKLKQLWLEREKDRRAALWRLARQFSRTPVTIADSFDVDRFSRDLLEA